MSRRSQQGEDDEEDEVVYDRTGMEGCDSLEDRMTATMEHAVRIPRALHRPGRRTMYDVLLSLHQTSPLPGTIAARASPAIAEESQPSPAHSTPHADAAVETISDFSDADTKTPEATIDATPPQLATPPQPARRSLLDLFHAEETLHTSGAAEVRSEAGRVEMDALTKPTPRAPSASPPRLDDAALGRLGKPSDLTLHTFAVKADTWYATATHPELTTQTLPSLSAPLRGRARVYSPAMAAASENRGGSRDAARRRTWQLLQHSPVALRVVECVRKRFELWTPHGASHAYHGVELELRIIDLDAAFSLVRVVGEVRWVGETATQRSALLQHTRWSVFMSEQVYLAVAPQLHDHLYLAAPFTVYTAVQCIVAGYCVTTDGLVARQRRELLRPRESVGEGRATTSLGPSSTPQVAAELCATHTHSPRTTPVKPRQMFSAHRPSPSPDATPVAADHSTTTTTATPFRGGFYDPLTRSRHAAQGDVEEGIVATLSPARQPFFDDDFPAGPDAAWEVPVETLRRVAETVETTRTPRPEPMCSQHA